MGKSEREVSIIIKARNDASASLTNFTSNLLTIAGVAAAVGAVMYGTAHAIEALAEAAMEQGKADLRMAAGLASVGANTAENRKEFKAWAEEIEQATAISDESIQGVMTTLTLVGRVSAEKLKETTQAALDLATVLDIDVTTAAMLMAKAAQGNTMALTRYGIVLDSTLGKGQKFAALMGVIKGRWNEQAQLMAGGLGAALTRLGLSYDNLKQAMGEGILQSGNFRDVLATLNQGLVDGTKWFSENAVKGQYLFDVLVEGAVKVLRLTVAFARLANWLDGLDTSFQWVAEKIGLVEKGSTALADSIRHDAAKALAELEAKLDATDDALDGPAKKAPKLAEGIKNLAPPIDDVTGKLSALGEAFKTVGLDAEGWVELKKKADDLRAAYALFQKQAAVPGKFTPEYIASVNTAFADLNAKIEQAGAVGLPNMTRATIDAKDAFSALGEIGMKDGVEVARTLSMIPEALREIDLFQDAGFLSPKNAERMRADALMLADQWRMVGEQVNTGMTLGEELAIQLSEQIKTYAIDAALSLGDALVDAAFAGKFAFKDFIRDAIQGLTKMIMKALIMKAILAAIGFMTGGGTSTAVAGGIPIGGGQVGMATGGMVKGGMPGRDSVLALLTPGEVVVPASLRDAFENLAGASPGRGVGGRLDPPPAAQLFFKIDAADRTRDAVRLMEQINRLVERNGFNLTASEVLV